MALTLYIPSRQSEFTENIDLLGPSVWIHLQQEIRQPLREDIQNDSFPEATKWYQCWRFTTPAYPISSHPGGQYEYFYKPLRSCTSTTRPRPTDPRKFVVPKFYLMHSLFQRKYPSLWHYARSSISCLSQVANAGRGSRVCLRAHEHDQDFTLSEFGFDMVHG